MRLKRKGTESIGDKLFGTINRPSKGNMKIVLISGWAGSGKDTAAAHLVKQHGYIQVSFASAIKDLVSETYKVPREWFDDRDMKERPLLDIPVESFDGFSVQLNEYMKGEHKKVGSQLYHTPRSLCILEGSVKRSVDSDFWVKLAVNQMQRGKRYVISDCRYKSEIDAVKMTASNVYTLRVDRFDSTESTDPSERDLDTYPFDQIVMNRASKKDFLRSLDSLFLSR